MDIAEKKRMKETGDIVKPWERWGPYVSERAWGTVREDYSSDGDGWKYFPFELSHKKAYRWGEDGIGGICDRYQVLAFSHAFWNGNDEILKERYFGLGSSEGNHGEDVKELYYYLDNTPTHSYMKQLYKYPQKAFPYKNLYDENAKRGLDSKEYELIDTGIFDENRYFDIVMEYAKGSADDISMKVSVTNRGPEKAEFHYIPQLVFRNTWSWGPKPLRKPKIEVGHFGNDCQCLHMNDTDTDSIPRLNFDYHLHDRYLYTTKDVTPLFTDNETGAKDAFHRHIIHGEHLSSTSGTKAGFKFDKREIAPGETEVYYLRLSNEVLENPLEGIEDLIARRLKEADEFYDSVHQEGLADEEKMIQRQAFAGMLWNKQIYLYDVNLWLKGDNPAYPPPPNRPQIRNNHWRHLISKRIMSMPDKWEYPWFAAWDLAFHSVTLGLIDIHFAKEQIWYLLFDQFQHPNGQIPAYEWEFSELNPPVQAWAAYRLYMMEFEKTGKKDISFLKKCYHKLLLNFVWWVNKVDSKGNNVFEGGFLGLDNITVIDRSAEIPGGGTLEQSDGTGWMGMFCLLLMRISLELSKEDHDYESMAVKFFEHFVYISNALEHSENRDMQLWDEKDGFFYDVLSYPDGTNEKIFVRSLVGIIPLYAIDYISEDELKNFKEFSANFKWFTANRPDITGNCISQIEKNGKNHYVFSLLHQNQLKRVLEKVWDPKEFRSNYGLRSLSKFYENNPYEFLGNEISYEPGEAEKILKGGNSNWRGPLWFPTSFLLIESLKMMHEIFGEELKVQAEGEEAANTKAMAEHFAKGLISLFKEGEDGVRPIYSDQEKLAKDPHFKDHILFFEHFHGDTGRGLGASHQTGWTGLVANLIDEWCRSQE